MSVMRKFGWGEERAQEREFEHEEDYVPAPVVFPEGANIEEKVAIIMEAVRADLAGYGADVRRVAGYGRDTRKALKRTRRLSYGLVAVIILAAPFGWGSYRASVRADEAVSTAAQTKREQEQAAALAAAVQKATCEAGNSFRAADRERWEALISGDFDDQPRVTTPEQKAQRDRVVAAFRKRFLDVQDAPRDCSGPPVP